MRVISGADLRKMRLGARKTTVQMAEYAKVKTRKTYENWEKNVGAPSMNQFIAMCKACNYDPATVVTLCVNRRNVKDEIDFSKAAA